MSIRINIGCGQTPTPGWRNYDNSWSIKLAKSPIVYRLMVAARLLSKPQEDFVAFAQNEHIDWADASVRIPESDGCADVLYTSHMVEHLEPVLALSFLAEARRVLKPGGVIRIAVPDIRYHIDNYIEDQDADNFISRTLLTRSAPKTLLAKVKYLAIGDRNHQWMYDGRSLCKLLGKAGFSDPQVAAPGTTRILDHAQLDLEERVPESVFAEATNP